MHSNVWGGVFWNVRGLFVGIEWEVVPQVWQFLQPTAIAGDLHFMLCVTTRLVWANLWRRNQHLTELVCLQEEMIAGCCCGTWRKPFTLGPSLWNWRGSTCPTFSAWPSTAPIKKSSLVVRARKSTSELRLLTFYFFFSQWQEEYLTFFFFFRPWALEM